MMTKLFGDNWVVFRQQIGGKYLLVDLLEIDEKK